MFQQQKGFEISGCDELNLPKPKIDVWTLWKKIVEKGYDRESLRSIVRDRVRKKYGEGTAFWIDWLLSGHTVLGPLLVSEDLEEIFIDGNTEVYVLMRDGRVLTTGIRIVALEYFVDMINALINEPSKELSLSNPVVSAKGKFNTRITAVIPPRAEKITATIRKFPEEPLLPKQLYESGFLSKKALVRILFILKKLRGGMMIVGPTGSGKTTLLSTITGFLPRDERIVVVENFPEIPVLSDRSVRLLGGEGELVDLIYTSLRLRPDWLIIGEIRTQQEVKALEQALFSNPGFGILFTYHSENENTAIDRLLSQGLSKEALKEIKAFVVCKRERKGKGQRRGVYKVVDSFKGTGEKLEKIADKILEAESFMKIKEILEEYWHGP